jgi:hypothetical protein
MSSCEDIKHLMFACSRAKEIWDYLGFSNPLDSVTGIDRSGSVLVEEIITRGGRVPSLDNIGFAKNCFNSRVVYLVGKETISTR